MLVGVTERIWSDLTCYLGKNIPEIFCFFGEGKVLFKFLNDSFGVIV